MSNYRSRVKLVDLMQKMLLNWWLYVLVVGVFVYSAYYYTTHHMTPIYEAESTIFIGREDGAIANVNLMELQVGEQLVKDYTELVKTDLVLGEVSSALNVNIAPDDLIKLVKVKTIDESRFLKIVARHKDPAFAVRLANSVSEVLRQKAVEIVGAKNIYIVDYARRPDKPSSPKLLINLLIGFVIGFLLVTMIILIRLLLNNKIVHREEAEALADVPVLGVVPKFVKRNQAPLVVTDDYDTYHAESYRMIRTNLNYTNISKDKQAILFTSALESEGKTTTVANVAAAIAQTGKLVLVIDCDLRKPKIQSVFNLKAKRGITDYIVNQAEVEDVLQPVKGLENLYVITTGPIPPNPSELLLSERFDALIKLAKSEFDVILIDSPPVFLASDGLSMARVVDGVVVVTASRQSKKEDYVRVIHDIKQVGIQVLGTVITKVKMGTKKYYK